MLRVTIELVPFGIENQKRTLGTLIIANDGTGTPTRGNYEAHFYSRNNRRSHKVYTVHGFPRQTKSAWNLIWRLLNERFK
mgnify:CR=1 FL=1